MPIKPYDYNQKVDTTTTNNPSGNGSIKPFTYAEMPVVKPVEPTPIAPYVPTQTIQPEIKKRNILKTVINTFLAPVAIPKMVEDSAGVLFKKAVNTPTGKNIVNTIEKSTRGSSIFKAVPNAVVETISDKIAGVKTGKDIVDYYGEAVDKWEKDGQNPNITFANQLTRGILDSGVQSLVGVALNMIPVVGPTSSMGYWTALSSAEQVQSRGNVESIGNIAIDVAGDMILGNLVEGIFKKPTKELIKTGFVASGKRFLKESGKGFIVEGTTEPAQTFLKYANDYRNAPDAETRKKIIEDTKTYVRTGGVLLEFLIGGISGGAIAGGASLIGGNTNADQVNMPKPKTGIIEDDDKEFTPEQNKVREAFREDIKQNLTENKGNIAIVANEISKETGIDIKTSTMLVNDIAEDSNIEISVPSDNLLNVSKDTMAEVQKAVEDNTIAVKTNTETIKKQKTITASDISPEALESSIDEIFAGKKAEDVIATPKQKATNVPKTKIRQTKQEKSISQEKIDIQSMVDSLKPQEKVSIETMRQHFNTILKNYENITDENLFVGEKYDMAITEYEKTHKLYAREKQFIEEKISYMTIGNTETTKDFTEHFIKDAQKIHDIQENPDKVPKDELRFSTDNIGEEDATLIVDEGDLIIDRDGIMKEVTSGNRGETDHNKGYARVKDVTDTTPGGTIGYTGQMRQATAEEIKQMGLDETKSKKDEFLKDEVVTGGTIKKFKAETKKTTKTKAKKGKEVKEYQPITEMIAQKQIELQIELKNTDGEYSKEQVQKKIDDLETLLKSYGTEKSTTTTIDGKEITRGDFVQFGARVMIFDSVRSNNEILMSDPEQNRGYDMLKPKEDISIPSRNYVESEYERVGWTKTTGYEQAINKLEYATEEEMTLKEAVDSFNESRQEDSKLDIDDFGKVSNGAILVRGIKENEVSTPHKPKLPVSELTLVKYGSGGQITLYNAFANGFFYDVAFYHGKDLYFGDAEKAFSEATGIKYEPKSNLEKATDELVARNLELNKIRAEKEGTPLFKKGDKVSFTKGGKQLTGIVRYTDNETSTIDVDQILTVGSIPIGRIEVIHNKHLTLLDNENVSDILNTYDDIGQKGISDISNVPSRDNISSSREATGEISRHDRATMLVESGNGLESTGSTKLSKKDRQLINEEVESILESKEYSSNPEDYSQEDMDLMREYSGAGGKESVGGEGAGLLNEYYTPRSVIQNMWSMVEKLAPNAENAFEPSMGTGRFLDYGLAGIMQIDGAEISKVSGTISKIFNPESNITIGDFQELFFDKKTNKQKEVKQYDILIGNPPFGDRAGFLKGKGEESKINRWEEYFIKRGLDMTKDGGYLLYVVNSSFLKTGNSAGKQLISQQGQLIEAYRLPENSFEDTSIGTDIVIFKKLSADKADLASVRGITITDDMYFRANPGNVLGETLIRKNRFGQTESYVKGNLEDASKRIYADLGLTEYGLPIVTKESANRDALVAQGKAPEFGKQYRLTGKKSIMEGNNWAESKVDDLETIGDIAETADNFTEFKEEVQNTYKSSETIEGILDGNGFDNLLEVFDQVKELPDTTPPELNAKEEIKYLKPTQFKEFNVGDIIDTQGGSNMKSPVTITDIAGNTLKFTDADGIAYSGMAKATVKNLIKGGEWKIETKTPKKSTRAVKPPKFSQVTLPNKKANKLVIPIQNISNKSNYSPVEINMLKRIDRDLSIPSPTPVEMPFLNYSDGKYFNDGIYYSGEIYKKIDQLEKDKQTIIDEMGQEQYDKQKAGLENAIPKTVAIKDITFDPLDRHVASIITQNSRGDDSSILNVFAEFLRANDVALSPRVSKWDIMRYVRGENASKDTKPIMGFIKNDAKRLFNHFIKNELNEKTSKELETKYNKEKNGYVQPDFTKLPLEIADMAKQFRGRDFHMSETQKNGVGFLVNKGSGLIAYGVGVGKTHTLAIATVENMQKGWAKRPLFVVPKSTIIKTWIATLHEMFPKLVINNLEGLQAPIVSRLIREKGEDRAEWIKDGELSVISHEGILRLGLKEDELRIATGDLKDALWVEPKTKRGGEKTSTTYDEIAGNAQKFVTDTMISDLGFDHLSVDEVHNFRKVFQGAKAEKDPSEGSRKRFANVIGGTPSRRAQQLFLISQYIQKNNSNRNVFLASATPFENHATEVYNILSFIARDRMREMGLLNINDFFASFANFEVELDRKLDGEWINREKMKSFSNLPTLQSLLKEFIDYQEDPTLVRPDRRVITPHLQMSELQTVNLQKIHNLLTGVKEEIGDQQAFNEEGKQFYDASSKGEPDDGAFLKASTYSIANSISPYFIKEFTKEKPTAEQLVAESPKIEYAIEALKVIKNDAKTKDFGTFLFFGKLGVEYHPMIADYIAKELGYKKDEVAVLSGDVTDDQKETIKEKFNDGRVKVLLGGDQTKEGIDLQQNGFMTINLALGWNPTQISQVEGRVWRQGNRRSIAPLVYPLVENSGDSMIYGKFEEKGGRINDLFSYKGKMFDIGEIDPAEKKLALLTNPQDKAKMQIEIDKTQYFNERLLLDNDIKELKNIQADQKQLTEDLEYYGNQIKDGLDRYGNALTDAEIKDNKKEVKSITGKIERITAKLEFRKITDINANINDLEIKMLDMETKIKEIDKTYEERLAFFSEQYKKDIKNRKTIEQHMEEIQKLVDEVQERTPEEIDMIRNQKIAQLEDKRRAGIPEFETITFTLAELNNMKKIDKQVAIDFIDSVRTNKIGNMKVTKEEKLPFEIEARQLAPAWNINPELSPSKLANAFESYISKNRENFQKTNTEKEKLISFEQAKQKIEEYKKRLNLDFDVDFAATIFTGGANGERAYAVTYNNKISLTDNVRATTADHEMVHIVINNIDKILAFDGITRDQLFKAANNGQSYVESDITRLNEQIAEGFQEKVAGAEQSIVPNILVRFYQKLEILITKLLKALGKDVDVMQDFYNRLSVAKGKEKVTLLAQKELDRQVQFDTAKGMILAFNDARAEYLRTTRVNFEKIVEEAKNYSINLRRRDINFFDSLFAQSRDIYLKDKIEFKQADQFMKIGDERRMKKTILDNKFADMLKPFMEMKKANKEKVEELLMKGDEEATEYSDFQLNNMGLTQEQINGYKAVRKAFNSAHNLLLNEMEVNGVPAEEIDQFRADRVGYMPHKWKYRFAIKTQTLKMGAEPKENSSWTTTSMDVYKTAGLADKAFKELNANNKTPEEIRYVNDTLDSLDVDFFSEQRFSFENMKSIMAKAKVPSEVKSEMLLGLRNMVKEKGFGRNFIKRTGIEGYDRTEVPKIIANYFAGLDGFITKMEAGKKYFGVLETIDARRQKRFYTWIRDSIAYDMGNTKEGDAFKQVAYVALLANDISFLATNATQNWTVGIGELSKLVKGNAGKVYKGETALMKALTDWTFGKVTEEEKRVITGLIEVGRLGGEMTAELMGFKNNPVYHSISKGINATLYNTTTYVEQNVNRVPAFLAARRLLKEQGLSDKEANEQALSVSDDINFRYGKQHRPEFMRGRKSVLFVFNHYMRSFLYQLARDVKEKEFVSIAKKLFYTFLLAGTAGLPFAKLIKDIVKLIFGESKDEETQAEIGSWQLALERGVPASLLNIDLSNRVGIDILALSGTIQGTPTGTIQKLLEVKTYLGAVGSIFIDRIPKGIDLIKQGRYAEAGGKLAPDFIGNPLKAYHGATEGVLSQAGNPLIDENGDRFKYTTYEAFIKATGFTPTREQLAWDEQSKQWNLKNQASGDNATVRDKISKMIRDGNIEGARQYQEQARTSGELQSGTDYVRKIVKDNVIRDSVTAFESMPQTQIQLDKVEKDIATKMYGPKYTSANLTSVSAEFAFRRNFGYNDNNAEDLRSAVSNKDKVLVLKRIREELGVDEFRTWFNKGRKTFRTETGNDSKVLISDNLYDLYIANK